MAPTPTLVVQTRDRLGESPLWHAGEQAIYWTDLYGPTIHRLRQGGTVESWKVPGTTFIGSFVFVRGGRLLLAIDTGLVLFNPATGTFTPFSDPNQGREGVIYNDSKVDRSGRLWVGTLDLAEAEPRGILYCVDTNGSAHVGDSGFTVCNGPAFSPRGDVLYFSDSLGRRLLAYDLAPGTPLLRKRRVFASMGSDDGIPDGLTVDAEGGVWCAHYGAGHLTRYAPDGNVTDVVELPCPVVTSMSFGGPDLRTLFVTSGWSPGVQRPEEEVGPGGALFAIDTNFTGLCEPEFSLNRDFRDI
ncbi:MAG: SMP-30/gluconolactonase/LRE family protein [Aestuariivirga sp.]|uniref:SMP-30/gluconolactonase/LRE family protein n=1 Tax=Aestuariivirga sp. TaxID=2650926 RepID=UPI003016D725